LTTDNDTEGTETQDQSTDDSPVIKALRKQISDLTSELKSAPTRELVEAEVRTELERESAISEHLVALGHPTGMSAVLKGKLGDAEVTKETVITALQGIGYEVDVTDASPESDNEDSAQQASELAKVQGLSAKVQAATQGNTTDDLTQRINQTDSREELRQLMDEEGLSTSVV
jgi:hypothetical protein